MQKLYTVCDVAMHIIMSKSTTYSLESPKDPLLPPRFFTKPDKVGVSTLKNVFFFFFMLFIFGHKSAAGPVKHLLSQDAQAAFLKGLNMFSLLVEFQQHKKLPPARNEVLLHARKGKPSN